MLWDSEVWIGLKLTNLQEPTLNNAASVENIVEVNHYRTGWTRAKKSENMAGLRLRERWKVIENKLLKNWRVRNVSCWQCVAVDVEQKPVKAMRAQAQARRAPAPARSQFYWVSLPVNISVLTGFRHEGTALSLKISYCS